MSRPAQPIPAGLKGSSEAAMEIRLKTVGSGVEPVLYTMWRGHAFEGWRDTAKMLELERTGVIGWDGEGSPVVTTVVPTVD